MSDSSKSMAAATTPARKEDYWDKILNDVSEDRKAELRSYTRQDFVCTHSSLIEFKL
jgi:hypothetical protein